MPGSFETVHGVVTQRFHPHPHPQLVFRGAGPALVERHTDTSGWRWVGYILKSQNKHTLDTGLLRWPTLPVSFSALLSVVAFRGFSVSTDNRVHIFKPVSVQAMW